MPVTRLNHAVLYVRDVARTREFYENVLGFRTKVWMEGRAAFFQAPGSTNDHDLGTFQIGSGAGPTQAGRTTVGLRARRSLRDFADRPISSGVVNSLLAQEGGRDLGDYVLLDRVGGSVTWRLGASAQLSATGGMERSTSVRTAASPARGRYRPNPALGVGTISVGRLALDWTQSALIRSTAVELHLDLEGGTGARDYLRADVRGAWLTPAGPGALRLSGTAGFGTRELPGYRGFAVGGWGTLPGEPFRRWGGRRVA